MLLFFNSFLIKSNENLHEISALKKKLFKISPKLVIKLNNVSSNL